MNIRWEIDTESGWLYLKPGSTKEIDLKSELYRVLEHKFKQSSKSYNMEIQLIHDLRNDAFGVNIPHLQETVILKRYIYLLQKLMRLLPDDLIQFEWNNDHVSSLQQEFTNSLFQLASFYSILAVQTDVENTTETLDKKGVYFQYTAGILHHLELNYHIMLAQAQEVYYTKSVHNKIRDSVLVQLCQQIVLFYKNSVEEYADYCSLKRIYFTALSYYHYSRACHNNNKLHDQKAYLCEILKLINTVETKDLRYSKLFQDIESLKLQTINALNQIDETLIAGEIKDLPSAQLVKCLLPKDLILSEEDEDPLFSGLLSLDTIQEIEEYQLQLEEFVRNELLLPIQKLDDELARDRSLDEKIASLNSQTVPVVLEKCRDNLLALGSYERLRTLREELKDLKLECRQELDCIWSLKLPETGENETVMKSFHIYEQYLKKSIEGDELIFTQIDELTPFLRIFDNYEQLRAYLPDKEYAKLNPNLADVIKDYETLKKDMDCLDKDKANFVKSVNEKHSKIDLIELVRKDNIDVESVFKKEIVKFEKEMESLEELVKRQCEVSRQCCDLNVRFTSASKDLKVNYKFKETVNVLKSTYDGFEETLKNLNQGLEFYRNLLANITSKKGNLL
ncbi:hypothetical protein CANINC_001184 [Pichia inconspicua]|uniref:BRO domain-containing protein 1 n=1 Tax=Pichia inconspicua TaxID=52247 RepID=A0A4T0X5B7_9ASCO|nr:hypothetical protein CANINC_001184 [[Candida] inconspicua]